MLSKVRERELQQQLDGEMPQLYPDKAIRDCDAAAQALHGGLILQNFVDPTHGHERPYWGRLHFMGAQRRPAYYDVHFEDGDVYSYMQQRFGQVRGVPVQCACVEPYCMQVRCLHVLTKAAC
jgi:hypothetical protein